MADDIPTLYYFTGSYFSQKAVFALEEKNIPFKKHLVNIGEGRYEAYEPWFMKINPLGQVPVLEHRGRYISDSPKIIQYLDQVFGGVKLMPEASRDKWSHYQTLLETIRIDVLSYGATCNSHLTKNRIMPSFLANKVANVVRTRKRSGCLRQRLVEADGDMKKLYEEKLAYALALEDDMFSETTVTAELEKVRNILQQCEDELRARSEGDWLCGPDFTVADICLAILLRRMCLMGFSFALWEDGKMPLIQSYYQRIHQSPVFMKVCVNIMCFKDLVRFIFGDNALLYSVLGTVAVLCAVGVGVYLNTN